MLPLVQRIVADITRLFAEIHDRRERVNQIRAASGGQRNEESVYSEELRQVEQEIEKEATRLDGFLAELRELGVELDEPGGGTSAFTRSNSPSLARTADTAAPLSSEPMSSDRSAWAKPTTANLLAQ